MSHHEKCRADEIFIGNTDKGADRLKFFADKGLKTIRLGDVAFDIYGKQLPSFFRPPFVNRSEIELHHAIMMEKTFGPNWRTAA